LNSVVTHSLKAPGFIQPLILCSEKLVSKCCFQMGQLVYRYGEVEAILGKLSSRLLNEAFDDVAAALACKAGSGGLTPPPRTATAAAAAAPPKSPKKSPQAQAQAQALSPVVEAACPPPSPPPAAAAAKKAAVKKAVAEAPTPEELERKAVEKHVGSYVHRVLERSGALAGVGLFKLNPVDPLA
jgi:hypothetical protein